jgi:hypothetical protein
MREISTRSPDAYSLICAASVARSDNEKNAVMTRARKTLEGYESAARLDTREAAQNNRANALFAAVALASLGERKPLQGFLANGQDVWPRETEVLDLVRAIDQVAGSAAALAFAEGVKSEWGERGSWLQDPLDVEVVRIASRDGEIEKADRIAANIRSLEARTAAQVALTESLIPRDKRAAGERALKLDAELAAREADRTGAYDSSGIHYLARLSPSFAEDAQQELTERLLKRGEDACAHYQSDDRRSDACTETAMALARLGRLYEAKVIADRASKSLHKLRAYAAIVLAGRGFPKAEATRPARTGSPGGRSSSPRRKDSLWNRARCCGHG